MTDYRIERVWHQDELYTPILDPSGAVCDRTEAARLARAPSPVRGRGRQFIGIAADESAPRAASGNRRVSLAHFRPVPGVPVHFGDSELEIGRITWLAVRSARAVGGGAVGRALLVTVTLLETRLAELIWDGIARDVLGGLCAVVSGPEVAGCCVLTDFLALRLGAAETTCLSPARVLAVSEDEDDPPPASRTVPWDDDLEAL
jgi:hypothetical protein